MGKINGQVFTLQHQILLRDFLKIYEQKHMPTLALGPRKKYESLLKNHVVPALGHRRLCDVGTEDVQTFLNAKKSEGLSWWTRNDLKGIISGIFTKASEWGYWTGVNPALKTSLGPRSTKRKKMGWTDEQIQGYISALPTVVQLTVATLLTTGMRESEMAGLKWGSVDLGLNMVRVQETYYRGERGETKTEESHRDLWLGSLGEVFAASKPSGAGPDDYVFQIDGRPIDDRDVLRRYLRPTAKRLGLHFPGFGWRTFRRMNITALQSGPNGVNVFEAMAQAGHTKPETTMKYTLIQSAGRQSAITSMQQRWIPESLAGILRKGTELEVA
jgi:integrase